MGALKGVREGDNPSTFFHQNVHQPYLKLVGNDEASFLEKKLGHLRLIGSGFFWSIIDTISGIGTTIKSIFTQDQNTWIHANNKTDSSNRILAFSHFQILHVMNGNLKATESMKGDGLVTHYVKSVLVQKLAIETFRDSNYLIVKHVASRLTFAVAAVACIVARAADAVIGTLAAVLSLVTFGRIPTVNAVAYRGLQFTGIIHDLTYLTTKIINPWIGGPGH